MDEIDTGSWEVMTICFNIFYCLREFRFEVFEFSLKQMEVSMNFTVSY